LEWQLACRSSKSLCLVRCLRGGSSRSSPSWTLQRPIGSRYGSDMTRLKWLWLNKDYARLQSANISKPRIPSSHSWSSSSTFRMCVTSDASAPVCVFLLKANFWGVVVVNCC
jgi:hypothetical protein